MVAPQTFPARCAGFSAVAGSAQGKVVALYGSCDDHYRTAFRAELKAVIMTLRIALTIAII